MPMDNRLITLKLLLDGMEIPFDISTIDDRKVVQKAVYLGQRLGPNLGYQFGWYVMGPYSPDLTTDYYQLYDVLGAGDKSAQKYNFSPKIKERLDLAKQLFKVPDGVSQADWLEALASIDYLVRVSGIPKPDVKQEFIGRKPHLTQLADSAIAALQRSGLMQ